MSCKLKINNPSLQTRGSAGSEGNGVNSKLYGINAAFGLSADAMNTPIGITAAALKRTNTVLKPLTHTFTFVGAIAAAGPATYNILFSKEGGHWNDYAAIGLAGAAVALEIFSDGIPEAYDAYVIGATGLVSAGSVSLDIHDALQLKK